MVSTASIKADQETIQARRAVCGACPERTRLLERIEACGRCRCPIVTLTLLRASTCPLDKW